MGDVISKNASVDDIAADGATTMTYAQKRGGRWEQLANDKLGPAMTAFDTIVAMIAAAQQQAKPAVAALDLADHAADKVVGKVSDELWNAIGRPAHDPGLALTFPGGITWYTEAKPELEPDRVELLAQLIEAGLVKNLDAATTKSATTQLRSASGTMRKAVDDWRPFAAKLDLLEHARVAVGRNIQVQLAALKRAYKAEGFSEADIHTVIPDRPRQAAKTHAPAPAPQPAPARKA